MVAKESLSKLVDTLDTGQEVSVEASALAFAAYFGNFDNCSSLNLNAVDFVSNPPDYALVAEENLSSN